MLLRALLAQTRRAAKGVLIVNAERLRPLGRAALSTGARAEKASASSMPHHLDAESSSSQQSDDLDDFRAMLSDFASREIAPLAEEIDRKNTAPMDLWTKMGEFGLHGITVPPEHGGLGLGYLEHVVAMEELSRASGAVALSYGAHSNLCVSQLSRNASEEQKAKFLPKLLSGEHVGALAMSEPNAGSDVVSMRTKATKVDGGWLLDGTKMWITNGTVADVVVLYAKTDPLAGSKGVTAFIIDKKNTKKETFSAHQKLDKLGMRGSDTCELVFNNCFVPDENVLGEVGKGVYVLFSGLDYERLVLSGGPLGLARAALDVAVPYAAQRKQFDTRIGDFQLVAAKLADGWTRTQAARALVYSAAAKADAKKKKGGESSSSSSSPPSSNNNSPYLSVSGGWSSKGERARECAAAILFSAETATQVALDALQVLGGNGYINEYPTGRILRDAKLYEIGAGTSEIRRLVIGRELVREAAEAEGGGGR